ncbi:DUF4870 domain-containing protein [Thermonema rossianum]|uniref:DUF4870 domain-containing protein n=1 Tax=Thermonema rossianum TaxID=55505 RepID=UPI00056E4BF9|nr:DUF4870 domain-containing protein [Thermonema rossianum]
MIQVTTFPLHVHKDEASLAAKGYMMSIVAVMAGLPLPVLNLLATLIFFFSFRKDSLFVRWHAMQAMISQLTLFVVNAAAFWWTMLVVFSDAKANKYYVAYLVLAVLLNIGEFIATLITMHHLSKQRHVRWWFYADYCDEILGLQTVKK